MAQQPKTFNKTRDPANFVSQTAVLRETIVKENRYQKLYTNYSINPFRKSAQIQSITGKPNSLHDTDEGEEDSIFKEVIKRANQEPVKKYTMPLTESQEYGWNSSPLVEMDRGDRRVCFPRQYSAITKYMDVAWKIREQQDGN